MRDLGTQEGRRAFGADPQNYDRARPPYPDWVFEVLQGRCGLAPRTRTFEIGAGTGSASARLADFLAARFRGRAEIVPTPFEDAALPPGAFDLGIAATSFHWLEQKAGL